MNPTRPRLLILDDLFGRNVPGGRNTDRENLCAHFLWQDATWDTATKASKQKVMEPIAEAVFCRAQTPATSQVGDTVENDLESALAAVRNGWVTSSEASIVRNPHLAPWAMVLLDLCFYTGKVTDESDRRTPGMPEGRPGDDDPRSYFGLTLLDAIHGEFPELPIFILSSKPREEVSLEFSRRGALGFIDRSALDGPELLQQALWNHGLLADPSGEVVGHSLPLLLALREARRGASHRENILIRGERGSGKELIAQYINRAGSGLGGSESGISDSSSALATVNSAVFTPNLFASELFGIEPKTATGVDGKMGLIEMAKGGDLFLDEIGDMPLEVQAAMLRVLQDRKITRVGGRKSIDADVRFLSATNIDLDDSGREFRPDLLDRLRIGGTIWLPPLRERPEDIPALVDRFLREAEAMRPGIRSRKVTPEAIERLCAHDWPGNIRELRSIVFEAVTRHPDVEHLVVDHIRLGQAKTAKRAKKVGRESELAENRPHSIAHLFEALRETEFPTNQLGEWAGELNTLQREQMRLLARLLQASITATKRRTPENPEGVVQIHPAAKLATGNSSLTASQSADLFKRLLGPIENELDEDLREALEISIRLRPKAYRRKPASTKVG